MQGWEARPEFKMRVESGFKECRKELYQWPWEWEKI